MILIRGAGDMASGIALRLYRSGFTLAMTDLQHPTSIRRTVCFSEAIPLGTCQVEGIQAQRADTVTKVQALFQQGIIPVLPDDAGTALGLLSPDALIDARLMKVNLGTALTQAPIVIGIGPGFTAGVDCHAVVETQRGHYLGRVIYEGAAAPNTGIPGLIGGYGIERLIKAPCEGIFTPCRQIGDTVEKGDIVAYVGHEPVKAQIGGILRGILPEGTPVYPGMKSGDVDPRCEIDHCRCASDKALSVAGGALEALLHFGYRE